MLIKDLPKEIQELAYRRRGELDQGSKCEYLANSFTWGHTAEGGKFWYEIEQGNFKPYYDKYGMNESQNKATLHALLWELKNKKISVNCETQEEANELFGLDFPYGVNRLNSLQEYKELTCYSFNMAPHNHYGRISFFKSKDYEIITFKQLKKLIDLGATEISFDKIEDVGLWNVGQIESLDSHDHVRLSGMWLRAAGSYKEQLINLKSDKNEVLRKTKKPGSTRPEGTRAIREKIKIASASRPAGSRITNCRRRADTRKFKIGGSRIFFN